MKKQSIIAIAGIVISAALAVASFILLPDVVTVQLGVDGESSNTMPKLFAILIPAALGVGGALSVLFSKNENKNGQKALIVSAVGIVVFVFMLVVNL
jgi:uncharacterized membrane protein